MEALKLHAVSIFAFGVGLFMLNSPNIGTGLHWGIGILTVIGAVLTIVQYGPVAAWKLYDWSVQVTRPYVGKLDLGVALIADVLLMAGLLAQGWTILFGMQFVACVIGYAVIRSFLTNYHDIYAFVNGSKDTA